MVLARSLTGVEVLTAIAWTLVVFAVLVIQLSKSEGKDTVTRFSPISFVPEKPASPQKTSMRSAMG